MACGCGLIGSPIISSGGSSPVYSKPAPRGGASALFSIEVLDISATYGIDVAVEHKNRGDTSWTQLAAFAAPITAAGVVSMDMTGFKQLYRIVVRFATGVEAGDKVLVGNMNLSWRAI